MRHRCAQVLTTALLMWLVPMPPASGGPIELTPLKQSVVAHYAALVHASYDDALGGVRNLADAIDHFVASPSADVE